MRGDRYRQRPRKKDAEKKRKQETERPRKRGTEFQQEIKEKRQTQRYSKI